jgi:Ni/Co efflux regulator RcnB
MKRIALLVAVVALALAPVSADARGGPKWKDVFGLGNPWKGGPGHHGWKRHGRWTGHGRWRDGDAWRPRFRHRGRWHGRRRGRLSRYEKGTIRRYFRGRWRGCGRSLPPGIRMNLARGKRLPPGIRRRYGCRLPRRLLALLPPRPGYVYFRIGDDLVLISRATNFVIDVARSLF